MQHPLDFLVKHQLLHTHSHAQQDQLKMELEIRLLHALLFDQGLPH